MKLNFRAILFAATAAFMSACCAEGSLELQRPGLENVDATKVELTTLVSSDAGRVRPFYVYELTLSSADESVVLDAKFVSDEQPLHAAVYSPAAFADAHRNTYVTGADGTTLTVGGVVCQVVSGNLKVTSEAGAYTVSGIIEVSVPAAEGEKPTTAYYDLTWSAEPVAVKFKELPTMTTLTKVLNATSNVTNGTKTVTVQLSTEGWSQGYDQTTYQPTYTGTGAYLAVDFYSEDGYLAAGTYKAGADPANPQPGEFVVGYDTTVDWGFGPMEMKDWGTCWWTVDNAAPVAEKILSGEIYVAYDKKSKEYTIDIDNGAQYAKFVGKIPALTVPEPTKPGGYTGTLLTTCLSATVQDQYKQIVLQLATDGLSVDPNTYQTTGTGQIFMLTIHAENTAVQGEAYIPTGKYDAADGTTEPNTWQVTGGMDLSEYGMGYMYWGTYINDIVAGTATTIELTEGTVWIGAKGGEYIINYENGDVKYRFTGAISGIACPADDDGGYVGEDAGAGEFSGVELAEFIHLQPGTGLVTVYLGEQAGMTYDAATSSVSGVGNYLKFDVYSEDGTTLVPGVYTPCEVAGTITEGTFGIGWDPGDLWGIGWVFENWGTCYMTKAEDGTETGVKVTDGTITVEEDGGEYTITIESSAMNLRYIGPLQ